MISRIMLSLRKAADPLEGDLSLGGASNSIYSQSMKFSHHKSVAHWVEDDLPLGTYPESEMTLS
jgi:hypothetical protein